MLTIKQALDKAYQEAGENAYFGNGFYAAIKFAQTWISVEEDLPPVGSEVIAKIVWDSGKEVKAALRFVNEDDCAWRTLDDNSELSYFLRVTHWRLIQIS